jgi:hypothetical protein
MRLFLKKQMWKKKQIKAGQTKLYISNEQIPKNPDKSQKRWV